VVPIVLGYFHPISALSLGGDQGALEGPEHVRLRALGVSAIARHCRTHGGSGLTGVVGDGIADTVGEDQAALDVAQGQKTDEQILPIASGQIARSRDLADGRSKLGYLLLRVGPFLSSRTLVDPEQNQRHIHTTVCDGKNEVEEDLEVPLGGEARRWIPQSVGVAHFPTHLPGDRRGGCCSPAASAPCS
jgi:hypothetical protein